MSPQSVKERCAKCGSFLELGDKYCRYCGRERGKGIYDPRDDHRPGVCIYGPPPRKRIHKCSKCPKTWESCQMVPNPGYCPRCGNPGIIVNNGTKP